jgi:rRNA maturation RNase YbeY
MACRHCCVQELPVRVLGDVVISLDAAVRQAAERKSVELPAYGTYDEVRVLLVHGVLHLLGYDHEIGPEACAAMASRERELMASLGWQGQGLIELADLRDMENDHGHGFSALNQCAN